MPVNFTGKGTPIEQPDLQDAAKGLGGDIASLWSLVTVETKGFGYLSDRRPQILFERHIFHRRTDGKFDQYPNISNATPGGYSDGPTADARGIAEYTRLAEAMKLDEKSALESASWGLGQIMGFNAGTCGFTDVYDMVNSMVLGEGAQLRAIAGFITANKSLLAAFTAQNWAGVALNYNGKDYAKNQYDVKLQQSYERFRTAANQPALDLRTAQACLMYLKYDVGGVDGVSGPRTKAAMIAYRAAKGIAAEVSDADVMARLRVDAGI